MNITAASVIAFAVTVVALAAGFWWWAAVTAQDVDEDEQPTGRLR